MAGAGLYAGGITVDTGGADMRALFRNHDLLQGAVKSLKGQFRALGADIDRAGQALGRMEKSLKGVLSALMQTANVVAGLERGMMNLYRWSRTGYRAFANCLDGLASGALYLKNSLAAMAAPMLSAVSPAIGAVTDRFADLFNVVNQVFARLTGATTYVVARKTADAWDSVSGRITQAASAVRRYIAGFDQLNVMFESGGASGSGSAASDMFETREIESGISDFAGRLKAALEDSDWNGLGTMLGERLNAAVAGVDWNGLGEKVGSCIDGAVRTANAILRETDFVAIGTSIADFLSSAVGRIDFGTVGEALARVLSSAIELAAGAVARFDWSEFGGKLADGLNGFVVALSLSLDGVDWAALALRLTEGVNNLVSGVDWAGVGKSLGRRISDLIAICGTAAETFDWAGAGTALATGLNNLLGSVDWTGLGRWLNRTLQGVLDFGLSFVNGFDAKGFADGIGRALEQVDWKAVAQKLWTLLRAALDKLGEAAQTLLFGGTTQMSVAVALAQSGWKTLSGWIESLSGGKATGLVALARTGWTLVSKWVEGYAGSSAIGQAVGLTKSWGTVSAWVSKLMGTTAVEQEVGLAKTWDWKSVSGWVSANMGGKEINQGVGLAQKAWKTVSGWVSGYLGSGVDEKVGLVKAWKGTALKALGLNDLKASVKVGLTVDKNKKELKLTGGMSKGSVSLAQRALGGIFANGIWRAIPQYARGTLHAGSLFAAGEAGPELVGHIGGRTEVLNKSQLAATMFAAVSAGMLDALGKVRFRTPAMAGGSVVPYEIAAQIALTGSDIQDTLNANNEDLIQTIISVAGQLVAAVGRIQTGQAPGGLSAQQLIGQINRQTNMFGASPLKGV